MIFDIETCPTARALAAEYPAADRLPPSNYVKEEAIARWREKDTAAWKDGLVKEASLSPRLGRIVCVGVHLNGEAVTQVRLDEADEAGLVLFAFTSLCESAEDLAPVVTFNGAAFDLPFLQVRAAILGLRLPKDYSALLRRYTNHPHADLRALLTNWDSRMSGTLHDWCEAFGIPVGDKTSGEAIYGFVQQNNAGAIAAHCRSDIELTAQLAAKMSAAGMIL